MGAGKRQSVGKAEVKDIKQVRVVSERVDAKVTQCIDLIYGL